MRIEEKHENSNILIVDDDPVNLYLLEKVLKPAGHNLTKCLSGKDALTKIESYDFDLVLLDIMMPEMDGFEVCRFLKQNPKSEQIPVIFITAKSDAESVKKGFEAGAQDYIFKPFDKVELLSRVHTQLDLKIQKDLLLELNKELDHKVKIRTSELQHANQKISGIAKKLKDSNESLDKKNRELVQTVGELTRSKINKKATTMAIVIALILFFISETFIEPYIEHNTQSFFASISIKMVIALMIKPLEMLLEYMMLQEKPFNNKVVRRIKSMFRKRMVA